MSGAVVGDCGSRLAPHSAGAAAIDSVTDVREGASADVAAQCAVQQGVPDALHRSPDAPRQICASHGTCGRASIRPGAASFPLAIACAWAGSDP